MISDTRRCLAFSAFGTSPKWKRHSGLKLQICRPLFSRGKNPAMEVSGVVDVLASVMRARKRVVNIVLLIFLSVIEGCYSLSQSQ